MSEKTISKEVVVCVYPDGKLAGMDQASGGYPYPVEGLFGVHIWPTVSTAVKYIGVANNEGLSVAILKYQYTYVEIKV